MQTIWDRQAILIYCVMVAGKQANFVDKKIPLVLPPRDQLPFDWFKGLGEEGIKDLVVGAKTGAYTRLTKCFHALAHSSVDVMKVTVEELEAFPGIGPKTARFFVQWTRPDEDEHAVLDTHILRWLRLNGYPDAPKSTPQSQKKYAYWSEVFVKEAHARNKTARTFDTEIWEAGAKRNTQDTSSVREE